MIPISKPIIAKNAKKYLLECLSSGWVSSKGPYVEKFEGRFADFVGTKYAVATSSGTHALHLALACLDIKHGDEVIIPTLTMIAAALPVIYVGAKPVLVDSEEITGNMDVGKVEEKINKKTRAIIAVHLNGHPLDLNPLIEIAKNHKLAIIEDAAESHGAQYQFSLARGRPFGSEPIRSESHGRRPQGRRLACVGSIGDIGCFSFYGNKVITCGEGGMAVTNSKKLADRMRSLRNLARTPGKHFYHQEIGFTYRMSSLQAALGLAQLEQADKIIRIKEKLAAIYMDRLKNIPGLILPIQKSYAKRIYWNFDITLSSAYGGSINNYLIKHGVETRNFVIPLHLQPAFLKLGLFKGEKYPVAEKLSRQGLSLPLGPNINPDDINHICHLINTFISRP